MGLEFNIKDCALIAIATGEKAQNLRELNNSLKIVPAGCLYFHFWGGLLRPDYDDPEFQNDFAIWASRYLRNPKLAEQLSLIDPNAYKNIEELRQEVIEIIEQRLYESEHVPWVRTGQEFHFIRSQIVIFDTGVWIKQPEEFIDKIPNMSLGSIFYHFIDSRRRTAESKNDFSIWLTKEFYEEYAQLVYQLDNIDPYFTTLSELRKNINEAFQKYIDKGA
ncbi:MAG: hypothetical protein JXN64_12400 [Spirochaetes bacterium]|nr:hypothetical protein [Spirochaetota bacterium]